LQKKRGIKAKMGKIKSNRDRAYLRKLKKPKKYCKKCKMILKEQNKTGLCKICYREFIREENIKK